MHCKGGDKRSQTHAEKRIERWGRENVLQHCIMLKQEKKHGEVREK